MNESMGDYINKNYESRVSMNTITKSYGNISFLTQASNLGHKISKPSTSIFQEREKTKRPVSSIIYTR